jgi:hypothetical protein
MTNLDPNKNDETLDIPDFIEDQSDDSLVDLNIFQMSDDDLYDQDEEVKQIKKEEKRENKPSKSSKGSPVLLIVLILLLFLTATSSFIFAMQSKNSYEKLRQDYLELTKINNDLSMQVTSLTDQITSLNTEIADLKKVTYTVTDGPLRYRNSPSFDANFVDYNGIGQIGNGETFVALEVIEDQDDTWVKITEGVYVCIASYDEVWVRKN